MLSSLSQCQCIYPESGQGLGQGVTRLINNDAPTKCRPCMSYPNFSVLDALIGFFSQVWQILQGVSAGLGAGQTAGIKRGHAGAGWRSTGVVVFRLSPSALNPWAGLGSASSLMVKRRFPEIQPPQAETRKSHYNG